MGLRFLGEVGVRVGWGAFCAGRGGLGTGYFGSENQNYRVCCSRGATAQVDRPLSFVNVLVNEVRDIGILGKSRLDCSKLDSFDWWARIAASGRWIAGPSAPKKRFQTGGVAQFGVVTQLGTRASGRRARAAQLRSLGRGGIWPELRKGVSYGPARGCTKKRAARREACGPCRPNGAGK